MKDKMGVGVAALILIGVIFYLYGSPSLTVSDIVMVIIPLLLAIGALIIVWDRIKSKRAGLPVDDERAKKLHWKAGAYTYYVTIWLALGTIWYNILFAERLGFSELTTEQVIAVIILVSAIFWFLFQLYFRRKGDVE